MVAGASCLMADCWWCVTRIAFASQVTAHRDGIKLANTTHNPPPARLLDITRLMRRVGKVLTGVDRVELAYLRALLADSVPVFGLIRTRFGYLLLDGRGLADLQNVLAGPHVDLTTDMQRRRAWRLARRLAVHRALPMFLESMLRRAVPHGASYVNVGHSNLTERVLSAVKSACDARISVMIHDVIPLEFPEFQRSGTVPQFNAMLARVAACADHIIYNSQDTRARAEFYIARKPDPIVAHLGTELAEPDPSTLPADLPLHGPYFVCLGTIEPRKNHAFLLDIWQDMAEDAPHLLIVGNRGWNNDAVFARLDVLPKDGTVREISGLNDGALSALIAGARGVLFPTFAEGFGLPATEAVACGVPVIVNELDIFRETMGDIPIYASVSDRYLWINKIKELAGAESTARKTKQFDPPTWAAHFKIVLRLI